MRALFLCLFIIILFVSVFVKIIGITVVWVWFLLLYCFIGFIHFSISYFCPDLVISALSV